MRTKLVYIALLLPTILFAQKLEDRLVGWLETHGREELVNRLDRIKAKYPDSPVPLYLEAFIEEDGSCAIKIYRQIVEEYPHSTYAESAIMKLGQYYFLTGNSQTAKFWYDRLVKKFPRSVKRTQAKYFAALCLISMNKKKKAIKELKNIVDKFPDDTFHQLALEELDRLTNSTGERSENTTQIRPQKVEDTFYDVDESGDYTVQIGAFTDQNNAIRLKESFPKLRNRITIVPKLINRKKFYLVWIGNFPSRKKAQEFGNKLKDRYNIQFRVVKK